MEFICYADWSELPASVDQLFALAEKESLFFSRIWFENLHRNGFSEDQTLLLACVLDGDKVVALLPLIQPDGEHAYPVKHLYTSLYTLLLDGNDNRQILACLIEGLRDLPLHSLQLEPVADSDSRVHQLQQTMTSYGYSCHRYFSFYNWYHRTNGESFSDYMAARPSRVRNTVGRKQRKLEREQDFRIELFTGSHLDQALADYQAVYNASWKANEVFEPFVEGLAKTLSESGWLRLAILYIDNHPAAAQFWFVAHGKASIFKLVYDEAWKRYSPGTILLAYLMEQVIDRDKVDEIDFLTGNDAYKQDWMSQRRQRWRLSCIDNNPQTNRGMNPLSTLRVKLKSLKEKVYNR
ncbi:MAG: GNAT family N-acetyltransferase [Candidatus Thiodiazotropha sp. (ex Ctena orbiculata)]|nr:GNAT family N-acetyltransferase [Candidatus Thiodiazotropha taylori]